ncbi:MAG TPA: DUF885 domain-containing protein [Gemmatimonadaceae bacterium]|nr:DUF885 domain-containing protein [Gemmatimonadaceae bacterium]
MPGDRRGIGQIGRIARIARMRRLLCGVLCLPLAAGAQNAAPAVAALANAFVLRAISFTPGTATQDGLHRYRDPSIGRVTELDGLLDAYTPAELDRERAFYRGVKAQLAHIRVAGLDPETRVDYAVLQNAVASALFALDDERAYEWRPQLYAEDLGGTLFSNISLEYADTATRARDLTSRVERVPAFIAQAMAILQASNPTFRQVAVEETGGVIDLIDATGAAFVSRTPSVARYATARIAADSALLRFQRFVRDTLPRRAERDWRVGPTLFAGKWRDYLQVAATPAEMLRAAEDSVTAARAEMLRLAEPLHAAWFPDHHHAGSVDDTLNAVVGEVLARIGADHADRDSLLTEAEHDVATLEQFVRDHRIVSLDDFSNLMVIPTPLFMRGIYGVAGAVFAPPLEPHLATFYWVTPIPSSWPADRAEAKLREYNRYKMLSLTTHEAVPGHVVQGLYAGRVQPAGRRVLRAVYANTPYVEGWAVYTEHMMRAEGVNGGDSVKARLTELKGMLRIYVNAIIDIRLHTMGMREADAVTLMMRDAFQERPEAEAKLQRAKLDYVQLVTYFAGEQAWKQFRREVEQREGARFNLCRFHDTALLYGPVPVPTAQALYDAGVAPAADAFPSRCQEATQ